MKIFGIGLSKTGTKSLMTATEMLGFRSKHFPREEDFGRFDAFADTSVAVQFERLDRLFPGSKFIYTVRAMEPWLESCARHFAKDARTERARFIRRDLYRTILFDERLFREASKRHEAAVEAHFAGRGDLLTLDICGGDGWGKLCRFLGEERPSAEFPRVRKAPDLGPYCTE
jgi:hypothetical protein